MPRHSVSRVLMSNDTAITNMISVDLLLFLPGLGLALSKCNQWRSFTPFLRV